MPPDSTPTFTNLNEVLRWRAIHQPEQRLYTFLADGETEETHLTYQALDVQARALGAELQHLAAPGERALLLYPPGPEYLAAFFGCLYAGVIAVPIYPPRLNRPEPRLQVITADAQATVALTNHTILANIERRFTQAPELKALRWFATDDLPATRADTWRELAVSGETLAFLQYTSGSTSAPKGVKVSHGNLLHNLSVIHACFGVTAQSRGVTWLPPYHDMGLIGGLLEPMYAGAWTAWMSPTAFLQNPSRWLQAISHYRATVSGSPNFAYDFCVEKITAEQKAGLDLSCWEVAFNGAEPIRAETMERFTQAFAPSGFHRETFYPCYGLAESTLIVTGGNKDSAPVTRAFQAAALEQHAVIVVSDQAGRKTKDEGPTPNPSTSLHPANFAGQVASDQPPATNNQQPTTNHRSLVGCGQARLGQQVVIAHPETQTTCPANTVGEIWISGPSVAQGYWNRAEETAQTFQAHLADTGAGPFLRTGDLGFCQGNELYITGRLKDLIVIRGRNHYPQDIELTVEKSHPALRPGGGAAFSIEALGGGGEQLVVVHEVERHSRQAAIEDVAAAIRQAVADEHELQVFAIVLLKPGSLPKTSSGKVQRHACRARFLDETLEIIGSSRLPETPPPENVERLTLEQLRVAAPEVQTQLVTDYLKAELARLLRTAPSILTVEQPLNRWGLDSLTAVELAHTLQTDLGITLPLTNFLNDITLQELSAQIVAAVNTASPPVLQPAAVPATVNGQPLSAGQQALWTLYQLAPTSVAYIIASALRIKTDVDLPALQRALQALAERHPLLRARFSAGRGGPTQLLDSEAKLSVQLIEAMPWSEAEFKARLNQEAYRPFNLEQGPPVRVCLFRRSNQDHILLFAIHHIVTDFWSLTLLVNELSQLYQAERDHTSAALPPPRLTYTDYVHWQTNLLASDQGTRLWMYWEKRLAGELPVISLPADFPRPPVQTYRGTSQACQLPPALSEKLKALSQAHGVTLYTTLLSAFYVLLQRYTGQDDLCVGSPMSGRTQAEFAGVAGYFTNTVVLRAALNGNPAFTDLLTQVRQIVLEAMEHQDYPFAWLVKKLQPERDFSRAPLFQVMFVFQKSQLPDQADLSALALGLEGIQLDLHGLPVETLALEGRVSQFDLTLMMGEVKGSLAVLAKYNADLFEPATIRRLLDHWRVLLEGIAANPSQRLADLPLLTEAEREQVLTIWNETLPELVEGNAAEYAQDLCIHECFEAQVAQTPNALAVVYEGAKHDSPAPLRSGDYRASPQQLTYQELNERADQLAHYLRAQGVGPEVRVGLCIERSPEMIIGLLGILKAGGAYVPLDPSYPDERLAFMMSDARIKVLVTQSHLGARGWGLGAGASLATVYLDTNWPTITQSAISNQHSPIPSPQPPVPDSLAYLIYTSGSTGRPKGVMVTHRSVMNLLTALRQAIYQHYPTTALRVGLNASLAFDASVKQLLSLLQGYTLYLIPETVRRDGRQLLEYVERFQLNVLDTTPSALEMLMRANLSERISHAPLLLLVGGEPISETLWPALAQSETIHFFNVYGPTECTVDSTICDVRTAPDRPTIGRPVANAQVYILDSHLQPVPPGVPGELYVGGAGVARGYLGRPELTAERFIPNPFAQIKDERRRTASRDEGNTIRPSSREAGLRLYKTGDLARYLPDGNIEFLGRRDGQVKMRGFRVELGEIEAALREHPNIQDAVVVVQEAPLRAFEQPASAWDKRIIAYLVPQTRETAPTASDLRRYLKAQIPDYMLPSAFLFLEALPLTPNGKLDRRALSKVEGPMPDQERAEFGEDFEAPRTPVEEALTAMWANALGVSQVGINDNFFELGGHSLMATEMAALLQDAFMTPEPLIGVFFENPTVAGLAEALTQSRAGQGDVEKIAEVLRSLIALSDEEAEAMLVSND